MQESYGEDVASHTGPESCADACEGMGEALTGVPAGRVLSRETPLNPGADAVRGAEGHTAGIARRQMPAGPARSEAPCMLGSSSRRNWEIPLPTTAPKAVARAVNLHRARRR